MIVAWLVIGTAVALCVAGWVPTVRDAVRGDHTGVPSPVRAAADTVAAMASDGPAPAVEPETVGVA